MQMMSMLLVKNQGDTATSNLKYKFQISVSILIIFVTLKTDFLTPKFQIRK